MQVSDDGKTQRSPLSEPEFREVRYVRKVYVCSRCGAWFRTVYFHTQWFCVGCLKDAVKVEKGRSNIERWAPQFRVATDSRDGGCINKLTSLPDRKTNLIAMGLLQPSLRRAIKKARNYEF